MEATIQQAPPVESVATNGHADEVPARDPAVPFSMGWMRDLPDVRDFTPEHEEVAASWARSRPAPRSATAPPASVDLRRWCSPIEDQRDDRLVHGQRGRRHRRVLRAARVQQAPRRLAAVRLQGDAQPARHDRRHRRVPAQRDGRAVLVRRAAGEVLAVRRRPSSTSSRRRSCTRSASPTRRRRSTGSTRAARRRPTSSTAIKSHLAGGHPVDVRLHRLRLDLAGRAPSKGRIPFPIATDRVAGGHAIVAVGYDDDDRDQAHAGPRRRRRGALIIRNSWGTGWGDRGYGYLPYDYVLGGWPSTGGC